jgi:hypothetical protein
MSFLALELPKGIVKFSPGQMISQLLERLPRSGVFRSSLSYSRLTGIILREPRRY